MNTRRSWCYAFALLVQSSGVSFAHAPSGAAPSEFEQLALKSDTEVTWSTEAATISGGETELVITAVEIKTSTAPNERTRGVRVDIRDAESADTVYIEEEYVQRVRDLLKKLEADIALTGVRYRSQCFGEWKLHRAEPRYRTLAPDYCVTPTWSGLSVSTLMDHSYEMPGTKPASLIELLNRALAALQARGQESAAQ